jgi:hypothetical protein
LQAVPQTSVIVDLVSANHVRQISSARLFKVAETKQNSVTIVRKGEAAIANDCIMKSNRISKELYCRI